jgi:hypothetical protein
MRQSTDIINIIQKARKDLDELKVKQFNGNTGTQIYLTETNNEWDVDQTVTVDNALGQVYYVVTATFLSERQVAPFAEFKYDLLIDDAPYDPATFNVAYDQGVASLFNSTSSTEEKQRSLSDQIYFSWTAGLTPPLTFNIKMKFHVRATDRGTLSVISGYLT